MRRKIFLRRIELIKMHHSGFNMMRFFIFLYTLV